MHEPMLSSPAGDLQASMRRNFRDLEIELEDVECRDIGGLALSFAQASITQDDSGDDEGGGRSTSRHTVAYYEAADARFPRFSVRAMGLLVSVVGALGLKGVRFADQPEFSKQYLVLATQALGAQAILDRKVRDWLLAHRMNITAGGTGVMVYRNGGLLHADELEAFAREAAELVGLLEQARLAAGSLKEPSDLDEVRAFAAQMPQFAGSMEKDFLARRVTKADIDAFLHQSRPRKIPKNIACAYEFPFAMSWLGVLVLPVSAGLGYAGAFAWATVLLLAATAMIYFNLPRLRRERGLLRRGEPGVARILGLRSTGGSENDQEVYKVKAHCDVSGESRVVECRARGKTVNRIAAAGRPTRILYDPAHPDRILLVDALVNSRGD
jgi:hypothetical protein